MALPPTLFCTSPVRSCRQKYKFSVIKNEFKFPGMVLHFDFSSFYPCLISSKRIFVRY